MIQRDIINGESVYAVLQFRARKVEDGRKTDARAATEGPHHARYKRFELKKREWGTEAGNALSDS